MAARLTWTDYLILVLIPMVLVTVLWFVWMQTIEGYARELASTRSDLVACELLQKKSVGGIRNWKVTTDRGTVEYAK